MNIRGVSPRVSSSNAQGSEVSKIESKIKDLENLVKITRKQLEKGSNKEALLKKIQDAEKQIQELKTQVQGIQNKPQTQETDSVQESVPEVSKHKQFDQFVKNNENSPNVKDNTYHIENEDGKLVVKFNNSKQKIKE